MKRFVLFILLCFTVLAFLCAQTAAEMEAVLNNNEVTYAQAARFILEAADVYAVSNPAQAFQYAKDQNWLPGGTSADDAARLDRIALLVMRSFDIRGGMFYTLFKNPHYAYHELVYQNVIQGKTDPAMKVSGGILLHIIGRVYGKLEQES